MAIYTLGTGKRTPEESKEILHQCKIEIIFDGRRFSTSQFAPFKRENLKGICEAHGIEYCHLGKELGGYQAYTKSEEFKKEWETIKAKAKDKITCILCAEKVPFCCHRHSIAQ